MNSYELLLQALTALTCKIVMHCDTDYADLLLPNAPALTVHKIPRTCGKDYAV
jgi:hypothetical protein